MLISWERETSLVRIQNTENSPMTNGSCHVPIRTDKVERVLTPTVSNLSWKWVFSSVILSFWVFFIHGFSGKGSCLYADTAIPQVFQKGWSEDESGGSFWSASPRSQGRGAPRRAEVNPREKPARSVPIKGRISNCHLYPFIPVPERSTPKLVWSFPMHPTWPKTIVWVSQGFHSNCDAISSDAFFGVCFWSVIYRLVKVIVVLLKGAS